MKKIKVKGCLKTKRGFHLAYTHAMGNNPKQGIHEYPILLRCIYCKEKLEQGV